MNQNNQKLLRMIIILVVILLIVGGLTQVIKSGSQSLTDYAAEHPELHNAASKETGNTENMSTDNTSSVVSEDDSITDDSTTPTASNNELTQKTENLQNSPKGTSTSFLIGASLNGESQLEQRFVYSDSFYYEPLSDNLRRYITGVSFPATAENTENSAISYDNLRYVHILHYDFDGNLAEGELICNAAIAQDMVEIFYELYCNEYYIEKVHLIDEYDGDDTASMEDNNTSCFNYRTVEGSTSLSKHALGLAIDVNPLYNPYITYNEDGTENVSPENGADYADRNKSFPYKIDENDLCYKLFIEHGFIWGGNWNSCKDYQHFQKTIVE